MSNLKTQITATVVGGLILTATLTAISWFLGWIPAIWRAVKSGVLACQSFLTTTVTFPIWAVLLLSAAFAVATWRAWARRSRLADDLVAPMARGDEQKSLSEAPDLTEVEVAVIRALIAVDGRWLQVEELAAATRQPNLIIQRAVSSLGLRRLITVRRNYLYGPAFVLSPAGQDVAMRLGWLQPNPVSQ